MITNINLIENISGPRIKAKRAMMKTTQNIQSSPLFIKARTQRMVIHKLKLNNFDE